MRGSNHSAPPTGPWLWTVRRGAPGRHHARHRRGWRRRGPGSGCAAASSLCISSSLSALVSAHIISVPLGAKPRRGAFIDTPTAGAEPVPKNWLKISRVFFAVTRPAECVDGQRRPRPRQCRSRRQGVRGGYSAYAIGHIPCGIGRDSRRIPAPRPMRRQCYSNTRRESIGRIRGARDPRGLWAAGSSRVRLHRSPSSPFDPARSNGPPCDIGRCGGSQR